MKQITEIKKAYVNAAKLVKLFGDKYLPIFERLHKEMVAMQKLHDMKAIALNIASEKFSRSTY